MQAWRIAKREFALDRTGIGGLHAGGRWHAQGVPVIYAGLSIELCALEKLAHTGQVLPNDLVLVTLSLPEGPDLYEIVDVDALPGWDALMPGSASANYGADFLRSGRALALEVPSVIVPEARNLVLNPLHPRFVDVTMSVLRSFLFDQRLRS